MAEYARLVALVKDLTNKTEQRRLTWEEMAQEDAFQVPFPEYTVRVYPERDTDGQVFYCMSILNSDGRLVEETSDYRLQRGSQLVHKLHEVARRSAMGVDKAIDAIFLALGSAEGPSGADEPKSAQGDWGDEEPPISDEDVPF